MSKVHPAVWCVPAGMLVVALLPLPHGYYELLRLVVCVAVGFLAWQHVEGKGVDGWVVALGVVALLFNPLWPVYLSRGAWAPIDLAVAVLLVVHAIRQPAISAG